MILILLIISIIINIIFGVIIYCYYSIDNINDLIHSNYVDIVRLYKEREEIRKVQLKIQNQIIDQLKLSINPMLNCHLRQDINNRMENENQTPSPVEENSSPVEETPSTTEEVAVPAEEKIVAGIDE